METKRPVTFTLAELWCLHDFIRHECSERDRWAFPPADLGLNEDIADAIYACETDGLSEYTLLLERGDILIIDFHIRRDTKTPEGASGKKILLKCFKARAEMGGLIESDETDHSYEEVSHANADSQPDPDSDSGTPI